MEEIKTTSKSTIIVVHGDVLDKIGFELAEKANRCAEIRLGRTISSLDALEQRDQAKYKKERYDLQQNLDRLKHNKDRVFAEYKKRVKSGELPHGRLRGDVLQNSNRVNQSQGLSINHIQGDDLGKRISNRTLPRKSKAAESVEKPVPCDTSECRSLRLSRQFDQLGGKLEIVQKRFRQINTSPLRLKTSRNNQVNEDYVRYRFSDVGLKGHIRTGVCLPTVPETKGLITTTSVRNNDFLGVDEWHSGLDADRAIEQVKAAQETGNVHKHQNCQKTASDDVKTSKVKDVSWDRRHLTLDMSKSPAPVLEGIKSSLGAKQKRLQKRVDKFMETNPTE